MIFHFVAAKWLIVKLNSVISRILAPIKVTFKYKKK